MGEGGSEHRGLRAGSRYPASRSTPPIDETEPASVTSVDPWCVVVFHDKSIQFNSIACRNVADALIDACRAVAEDALRHSPRCVDSRTRSGVPSFTAAALATTSITASLDSATVPTAAVGTSVAAALTHFVHIGTHVRTSTPGAKLRMPDQPPYPHSTPAMAGASCRGAGPPPPTGKLTKSPSISL